MKRPQSSRDGWPRCKHCASWFRKPKPVGLADRLCCVPDRKSSIRLPDFNCAVSQRGVLPRPAQVSDGRSGFRYFGTTTG